MSGHGSPTMDSPSGSRRAMRAGTMRGDPSLTKKATAKDDADRRAFCDFLNAMNKKTPLFTGSTTELLPNDDSLYMEISKGVLLPRLLNHEWPNTVRMKGIVVKDERDSYSPFERNLNHEPLIAALRELGIKVVNVGPGDLGEGNENIILGLLWQIIEKILVKQVSASVLASFGEGSAEQLSPEEVIRRWCNFVLSKSRIPTDRRLSNFGEDISDSEVYGLILHALNPSKFDKSDFSSLVATTRADRKAQRIIDAAYSVLGASECLFVNADDIVSGNTKLNFAFAAVLFGRRDLLPADWATSAAAEEPESTGMGLGTLRKGTNGVVADGVWIIEGTNTHYSKATMKWEHKSSGQLVIEFENGDSIALDRSNLQVVKCSIWDLGLAVSRGGPYKLAKAKMTFSTPAIYFVGIDEEKTETQFQDLLGFLERCKLYSAKPEAPAEEN